MPYYDEYRCVAKPTGFGTQVVTSSKESSYMRTFRSAPSALSLTSEEVPAYAADPYAYFLNSMSKKEYQARLTERGLLAVGEADKGHSAVLKKHVVYSPLRTVTTESAKWGKSSYDGSFAVPSSNAAYNFNGIHSGSLYRFPPTFTSNVETFAQEAYAKRAPTPVMFSAAQFLGELREGLPKLAGQTFFKGQNLRNYRFDATVAQEEKAFRRAITGKSAFYRGLGGEYLNLQFGWLPFIADVKNFATALATATQQLAKNGERVHRTYTLPPKSTYDAISLGTSDQVTLYSGSGAGILDPKALAALRSLHSAPYSETSGGLALYLKSGSYAKSQTVTQRFVGEFSSFYPLGFDPSSYLDRFNQLISLKVTPSVLWELTPWSWLADWFFKIQSSINANLLAADDLLVMHYGYATETRVFNTDFSYSVDPARFPSGTSFRGLPWDGTTVSKSTWIKRVRAMPFGFKSGGFEALTGSQAAILASLGLTKLR